MTYRLFKSKPSKIFCDEVIKEIRETGEPEKIEALYHDRIPKDADYEILRKVRIDGKKRPNGDRAPCPMCTPNRFLDGDLVYLPKMKIATVIGHCCADHAVQAERQFRAEEQKHYEESYLLSAFPFIASKRETLRRAKSIAEQTQQIYRLFRRAMPDLQKRLRTIKDRGNAHLVLHEVIRSAEEEDKEDDYFGPVGFRGSGRSAAESRDIDFGFMSGTTALLSNYRPVVELNDADRNLSFLNFSGDEGAAIDFIAAMTDAERRATVASLRLADQNYEKFKTRVEDCLSFFSPENLKRLNGYGSHPLNHLPFSAELITVGKRRLAKFIDCAYTCKIFIDPKLLEFDFSWEMIPFKEH